MSSDFKYDPESVVPDNIPPKPVGTVAEVQKEGLDTSVIPTCSKPVKNGSEWVNKGCPFRHMCKLVIRDEAGPQFFGIEYIKGKAMGGRTVRGVRDCFYIANNKDVIEENGGSLRIIAREGEPFKMVVASPQTEYKDRIVEIEAVPKFPRPGENAELAEELLKAITRSEEKERKSEQQLAINTGGVVNDGLKTRKKP